MAKYRQIHISFWQDPYIEELKPLEKYFYLYLMTNSKTKQCGCYEISMKLIKYETGLTQPQINDHVKLFKKDKKIYYDKDNSEFLIVNWLKHNSFRSPKVIKCIDSELIGIKTSEFVLFIKNILMGDTISDSLSKSIDTHIKTENRGIPTSDTGSQQEREQEENNNNKKNNNKNNKEIAKKVIDYLNKKTGKDLRYGDNNLKNIIARLNDKFSLDDLCTVVDIKIKDDHFIKNPQYLSPDTLFGTKFEKYLNSGSTLQPKKEGIKHDGFKPEDYENNGLEPNF